MWTARHTVVCILCKSLCVVTAVSHVPVYVVVALCFCRIFPLPAEVSPQCEDLLRKVLVKDLNSRLTIGQVMVRPLLTMVVCLLLLITRSSNAACLVGATLRPAVTADVRSVSVFVLCCSASLQLCVRCCGRERCGSLRLCLPWRVFPLHRSTRGCLLRQRGRASPSTRGRSRCCPPTRTPSCPFVKPSWPRRPHPPPSTGTSRSACPRPSPGSPRVSTSTTPTAPAAPLRPPPPSALRP